MKHIWLPFRQYSAQFRRWNIRPLSAAEARFVEAAERARQLSDDNSLLLLVNDPARELLRVILEYVSWHLDRITPHAVQARVANIVVDSTARLARQSNSLNPLPNAITVSGRNIYCAHGYDFASAVLFNANTYSPSVPYHRSRLILPLLSLTAAAFPSQRTIIIVHGDLTLPNRHNHFARFWNTVRRHPDSSWWLYDALNPDPSLVRRKRLYRPDSSPPPLPRLLITPKTTLRKRSVAMRIAPPDSRFAIPSKILA